METELAWVALNLARNINRVAVHELLQRDSDVCGCLEDAALFAQVAGKDGRSPAQLLEAAAAEIAEAARLGIFILTLTSEGFPKELREIYDPPLALYYRGRLPSGEKLSIVGSRSASHYGVNVARSFAREVASRGVPVVSGFARGIDTAAHLGAIEGGGTTLAVLGSGFKYPYPRENAALIPKVAENGAALTEFPLDTKPLPMNFPLRNRIIAGLGTLGTLVVEAAERSGALITARLASDQGRDVFAVPGNITSPTSAGTNRLIQDGARLVRSAFDIIPQREESSAGGRASAAEVDAEETRVLERLSADDPVHIDALSAELDMLPSRLLVVLLSLELKNRVRQLPGKLFLKRL